MLRFASSRLISVASRDARSPAVLVLPRFYHERVVDHYNNPRNVGSFDKNDPSVGTGLVGAPACGDVMKLQIRICEVTGRIIEAVFLTFGCGSAIASSSVVTEWVKGKTLEEVLSIRNTMLVEDAMKAAVTGYVGKKSRSSQPEEKGAEDSVE